MLKKIKMGWTIVTLLITLFALNTLSCAEEKVVKNFKVLRHNTNNSKRKDSTKDSLPRSSRQSTTSLRIQAAELIYKNKISYDTSVVLQTALDYIHKKEQALRDAYFSVNYLQEIVLEQKNISEEVRSALCNRIETVANRIEEEISIPSLVAKRGGLRKGTCIVLAVNNILNAVVLDVGYLNGISPGSEWIVTSSSGDELVRLRVAEVRRTISAAVPTKVLLHTVKKGHIARKAKTTL